MTVPGYPPPSSPGPIAGAAARPRLAVHVVDNHDVALQPLCAAWQAGRLPRQVCGWLGSAETAGPIEWLWFDAGTSYSLGLGVPTATHLLRAVFSSKALTAMHVTARTKK